MKNLLSKTKTLLFIIFSIFCTYVSNATLTVVGYDTTSYPDVTTKFFLIDDWNRVVPDKKQDSFDYLDNAVKMPIKHFSKINVSEEESSILICFDLAIGQRASNATDFNYAKSIVKELFSFIDSDKAETSLMSFDQISIIESDFTSETNDLATIVDEFVQSSTSNVFRGLTSLPVGGLQHLASSERQNKSIVLVTQNLLSSEEAELVIAEAKKHNIRINILYISDQIPTSVQYVANMTGGYAINRKQINAKRLPYMATVAKLAEGYTPYIIEGTSFENCDGEHTFAVANQEYGAGSFDVKIHQEDLQYIEAEPQWLDFSSILPGTNFEKKIKFTAKNSIVHIEDIKLDHPNFSIKSIEPGVPIALKAGESINLSIEFAPLDSSIVFAQLVVQSNACAGDTINITGGFPNIPPKTPTVKIISPECQEVLVIGDTMDISWTGLLPKDVIQLEYAFGKHAEKKWDTLAKNVNNLHYKWPVPDVETDSFRIKLIQLWPNNVYKTFDLVHNDFVHTAFFNYTGDKVITTCENNVFIWNASGNEGDEPIYKFKFDDKVSWATYVFDKSAMEDKYIGITAGRKAAVYSAEDYSLVWSAEFPISVNSIEFSKDGKYAVVSANNGKATIFRTKTGKKVSVCKLKSYLTCRYAQFHPVDKYKIMTVSSNDGIIRIFNLKGEKIDSIDIKKKEVVAQTQYATYNTDGTKIAFANISTKSLIVVNTSTKKEVYSLKLPDEESLILFSNFLKTTSGVEYLLTSGTDRKMYRWNAETGLPTKKDDVFDQHLNTVNTGVFSFDGKRVLSASNDKTAKIWNLAQRILQADTTCYLRIKRARTEYKDTIYVGETFLNELSIKTVENLLKNPCDFKYNIRSISIVGENASDFGIADELEFPLAFSGNSHLNLDLFFKPSDLGERYAKLKVILPADTIHIVLKGIGTSPGLVFLTNLIDFGEVYVDDNKDTLLPIAINISDKTIDIENVEISGLDYSNFREFLDVNSKIKSKDTLKVPLRFIPFDMGRKNAVLKITHNYNDLAVKSNLLGNGIKINNDTITCTVDNLKGKIGDKIECPIMYETTTNWTDLDIEKILFTFTFNASMLYPINESTELEIKSDEIVAGRRELLISVPYKPGKQTINGLYFLVALGNDTTTTLELKNAYCQGNSRVFVNSFGSNFEVTNVCQAGGQRLFDENGRKVILEQNKPNPVSSMTEINYELLEDGIITLKLYDQAGELIKTLVKQYSSAGKYKINFDTSELAAGTYFYVLTTPTQKKVRTMLIINN